MLANGHICTFILLVPSRLKKALPSYLELFVIAFGAEISQMLALLGRRPAWRLSYPDTCRGNFVLNVAGLRPQLRALRCGVGRRGCAGAASGAPALGSDI